MCYVIFVYILSKRIVAQRMEEREGGREEIRKEASKQASKKGEGAGKEERRKVR